MNKLKIAKIISTLTNPPIICIPLFFIICLVLSFENGTFDFSKLDTQFPKIKNKTVKTTIAQIRLQYPTDISKKTKGEYTDYLTKQKMAIPQPGL